MKKDNRQLILIDTDGGHDDVLALLMLLKSKQFNIIAITTVAGNTTVSNATKNCFYTLNLTNQKIPIYSGSTRPLRRKLIQAVVHGKSGLDGANLKDIVSKLTNDAPEQIANLIINNPYKIKILTLGPLTNLAKVLVVYPKIEELIDEIVIMGGAIDVCGNKNRVAEFNMFVDPEAADIIFRSNIPKVLVPLDPCSNVLLKEKDFKKISNNRIRIEVVAMMREFITNIDKFEGVKGALVYDVLAAYFLINKSAFKLQKMDIVIETKGEHTSGMTVVEKRVIAKRIYNASVVVKIDGNKFTNDFIKILSKQ